MEKTKVFNRVLGLKSEQVASEFIKNKLKFKILEQNYKNKIGEIDIIALDKKTIVFIEVKYSSTKKFGYPRERVNIYKQQKIRNVATGYLKANNKLDSLVRFDVVEVIDNDIEYIPNAF